MPLAVKGSAKAAEAHILKTCPAAYIYLQYLHIPTAPIYLQYITVFHTFSTYLQKHDILLHKHTIITARKWFSNILIGLDTQIFPRLKEVFMEIFFLNKDQVRVHTLHLAPPLSSLLI